MRITQSTLKNKKQTPKKFQNGRGGDIARRAGPGSAFGLCTIVGNPRTVSRFPRQEASLLTIAIYSLCQMLKRTYESFKRKHHF